MSTQFSTFVNVAIVIVQGSFHIPLAYRTLTESLQHRGFDTFQPELPSCSNVGDDDFPSKTLHDDSMVVQSLIERLVKNENKRVFVVMHSYGGLVGSNAISEDLSFKDRKAAGLPGGVFHLFYIAAFLLDMGQSVLGTFGESPNNDVRDDGRFFLKRGASLLYNDLPDDEAKAWESRLIPQSYAVQTSNINLTAYKYIPSTYVICEKDMAAPTEYQEMFAKVSAAKMLKLASGHMPMLSQLDALVDMITETVRDTETETKA